MGFFILLGIVGLGFGLFFLKKVLLKKREQRFVEQVIHQDDSYIQTLGDKERAQAKDLQDRWKEAIDTMRYSRLKKYGNPLYVLPWYMVMGESGSGKTTAITSARLSSPFAEIQKTSGISGTRNCDWWFSEHAIILDTAGRYTVPIDEEKDKEEWRSFLTLLAKYRKKEPINGLVVTVAADKLLMSRSETLVEDGQNIRRRIEELMRVLGAKFPVYILVTKCDLIQGAARFCDHLPQKSLDQAMGFINQDLSSEAIGFINTAVSSIGDRLRRYRFLLLHQVESEAVDPGLFLFPEEFQELRVGLESFAKGTFQENPYQETPILRGCFFSSGRQEGTPYSHFLRALGLIEETEVLPGTSKGLFLHDFFSKILPRDRGLFAPTQQALQWQRLTTNLGLASWVLVILAICGLLSFSFAKNLATLREVAHEFSEPRLLTGAVLTDVITMDRFRQAIVKVEEQNRDWWIPRLGLNESREVETRLKEKYCRNLKDGLLVGFNKDMKDRIINFSRSTPHRIIQQHVAHLMRRINLLQARLQGDDFVTLRTKIHPFFESITFKNERELIAEMRDKLGELYLYYLVWSSNFTGMNQERNDLRNLLEHILNLKGSDLKWLVTWVNDDETLSPLTLEDFWAGTLKASKEKKVQPAYTRNGKNKIESFLEEMETALSDPLVIAKKKEQFSAWYAKAYMKAWRDFWAGFSKGADTLAGKNERRKTAARMVTGQGPYFTLLDEMASDLEHLQGKENIPSWVVLTHEFRTIMLRAAKEDTLEDGSTLSKAAQKGKDMIAKIENKIGKGRGNKTLETQLKQTKTLQEYQIALTGIQPISASQIQAFEMATQTFNEDPTTGKSPFFVAKATLDALEASIAQGKSARTMFRELVRGPLKYLWSFTREETACHLQDLWDQDVLMEVQGITDQRTVNQLLMGQDGYALAFIKGPAAPFISRSLRRGYYAKKVLGGRIHFDNSFFSFLTKGARAVKPIKESYVVSIKALPTDANPNAAIRPHATRVELQCASETQSILNFNYPVKKTFNWSPETCGDVIFRIEVGSLVLTKKYNEDKAFPKFLKDFADGQRTFFRSEFPKEEAALRRLGIKYIKAKYQFSGHKPVIRLLSISPGRVPRDIVKCREH